MVEMGEHPPTIAMTSRRNATILGTMKMVILIHVLFAIEGPSDNVSFPHLRNFHGANFTVSSSQSDLNCTDLDAYAHSNPAIIQGGYTCTKSVTSTIGTPSSRTSPDISPIFTSTDSGGLSTGGRVGIALGVIIAVDSLTGLVGFVIWKKNK